jgi:hypothetical protein
MQMIQGQMSSLGGVVIDDAIVADPVNIKMKIWSTSTINSFYELK